MLPTSGLPFARAHAIARRLKSRYRVYIALTSTASKSAAWRSARRPSALGRIERVRRDDQPVRILPLQQRDILEAPDVRARRRKIDEQDVAPLNRALDAGKQHEPPLAGIRRVRPRIEVAIVQRDRQRPIAQRRGMVDELSNAVGDEVGRVRVGMRVKLCLSARNDRPAAGQKKGAACRCHARPIIRPSSQFAGFFPAIASACWRIVGSVVPTFNTSPAILLASSSLPAL